MVVHCKTRASIFAVVMLVLLTSAKPGRGSAYDEYDDYDDYTGGIDDEHKKKDDQEGICYVHKSMTGKLEPECCPGWERVSNGTGEEDSNADDAFPTCRPVCSPSCLNGTCEPHNTCRCLQGYHRPQNVPKHECRPTCEPPCLNSDCVGPNKCLCRPGYTPMLFSNVCRKVSGTQATATAAPVRLPPSCTPSCVYGRCVGTNQCLCQEGYVPIYDRPWECTPHCHACDGELERCEGPGTCTCVEGYARDGHGKCVPACDTPCYNGRCVATNKCECNEGYVFDEAEDTCFPACNPPCGLHGVCISINKCSCDDGYMLGRDGACMKNCTSEEQWDSMSAQCVPFQTPTRKSLLSSPPLECPWKCVHGTCVIAKCVCDRGWGNVDCGRRCKVLTNSNKVDALDCPALEGCSCPFTIHTTAGAFCGEGSEPKCGEDVRPVMGVEEITHSDNEARTDSRSSIPLWIAAAGSGLLMILLVMIPSGVELHRRHHKERRQREDDERTRIIKTKGAGGGRMQDVDLDEWRFVPH